MVYTQSLELCRKNELSPGGCDEARLDEALVKMQPHLTSFKTSLEDGDLPAFTICEETDDLQEFHAIKENFLRGMTNVFVLGTGGSSLGAQALAQLTGWRVAGSVLVGAPEEPRFHFFDNLDPKSFELALRDHDLKKTAILVISKSGGTGETLMQFLCVLHAFQKAELDWNLDHHILAITSPHADPEKPDANALRILCEQHHIRVLDHHPNIGGRFSVLSNVGLLPAFLMGLDVEKVRKGARTVLQETLRAETPSQSPPAEAAAFGLEFANNQGRIITALLSYTDQLKSFGEWLIQLWAESLGKNGCGTTPITAIGPVFQHSQLQMFLDGRQDKFFTVIMSEVAGMGPRVPETYKIDPRIGYLANKHIGDMVDCQQRATAETLAKNSQPVRMINMQKLDEEAMGGLFMHFMIETTLTGLALGVNVFDQPAVEEGKILARENLASM